MSQRVKAVLSVDNVGRNRRTFNTQMTKVAVALTFLRYQWTHAIKSDTTAVALVAKKEKKKTLSKFPRAADTNDSNAESPSGGGFFFGFVWRSIFSFACYHLYPCNTAYTECPISTWVYWIYSISSLSKQKAQIE